MKLTMTTQRRACLIVSQIAAVLSMLPFSEGLWSYETCKVKAVRMLDHGIDPIQKWIDWDTFTAILMDPDHKGRTSVLAEVSEVPCEVKGCCTAVFSFRFHSTDWKVFKQIFISHELRRIYAQVQQSPPLYVIDAGANCGYSTSLLAFIIPKANVIVAVEPEQLNVKALNMNTNRFPQVRVVNAGLWSQPKIVDLLASDGHWGNVFHEVAHPTNTSVRTTTVNSIQAHFRMPKLDLVKMDIEGAEGMVFGPAADLSWLDSTNILVIELHDRAAHYFGLKQVTSLVHAVMETRPFRHDVDNEHDLYFRV